MCAVKFLIFKLKLPVFLTVLALCYTHFFEKPRLLHHRVYSSFTSEAQVKQAQTYLHHYYFFMSYVDCGAAYDSNGHANNGKYLIQAMKAIHDCEKARIPIDRKTLVLDSSDDFMEDFHASQNPGSQVCKLGIDPWERFW